ncbi:Fic family protein [Sphingomonas sp. AR_OL41]|uniref:Fic family protein n=1 Tax=Sphingomonas sp. AR_OL41 TaxID=3042729 RepID=UPI00248173E5|nr:Fic/DOC family N-terminal domain-containing protein [Sphingomonas sp. AR_OL41]MDH7973929.1 Fic family protein [Sphingomonas sp. AR_OL41]
MRRDDLCHPVRQRLERLPAPFAAHYGVVPAAPPEDAIPLGPYRANHERAIGALARVQVLAEQFDDPYIVSRLLTRREAVSSSSIEGTNSTLDELLSLEEEANDEQRDAARQVQDYAMILDQRVVEARARGVELFTPDLIADLHRDIMRSDKDYRDVPGRLRSRVVWIGGVRDIAYSTFNPAPPARIEACLSETTAYMRCEGMQALTQSLIARMAIAHAHFEAVHPYRDGNGRVGRLMLPLIMAAEKQVPLYLSPYIEVNRQAYYDALKGAQQQLDWAKMVGFMSDAITGTVEELMITRDALLALASSWVERRRFRGKSAALRALDLVRNYPVITAKRLAQRLDVSIPAALTAIDQLIAAGILQERTGYSRNRVFVATEVLAILNRPFGTEPILHG